MNRNIKIIIGSVVVIYIIMVILNLTGVKLF
jgi:hypothetical protein